MSQDQDDQRGPKRPRARFSLVALAIAFVSGAVLATVFIFGVAQDALFERLSPGLETSKRSTDGPDEKPFYSVGKRTRGPLTLDELQINIPAELDAMLTTRKRTCFIQKIGELAEKAGDPEALDPADVSFLPTDGTWDKLTFFGRRNLLAQAIVSRAITLC
ncbi:MAG: hypothetical protein HKN63_08675 [Rhodobacteraceae bacterium]|nr:hypothetical protein [Paracoccaceae bacterium]